MTSQPQPEALRSYFRFLPGHEPDRLRQIQHLRYRVYCREFGFEREEDCPGGLEQDRHDPSAHHCLLQHRRTGEAAGCVRVIERGHETEGLLPLEEFCGHSLTHPLLHPSRLPSHMVCEVSRLAVPAIFRRRAGEQLSPFGKQEGLVRSEEEPRCYPMIGMAMFLAATALVGFTGRQHVFAMMEPKLARLLARSGLRFTRVGELIDYHGKRAAYYINHRDAERNMIPPLRRLYLGIRQDLATPVGLPAAAGGGRR
ncbi:MAG: PEP-CTERM/exosortase system-associated acyltransferase [Ectothiorhodospiraceae bacterium]|nr:PEP-CTERM/exosortase system-associated acyltransferase [Ectothiorhodospiraceae bacterium]